MTDTAPQQGLVRYWITFGYDPEPPAKGVQVDGAQRRSGGRSYGALAPDRCGVTAFDLDDAKRIISAALFSGGHLPAVDAIIENVDVSTLDLGQGEYYAPPVWRGVWYPAISAAGPTVDEGAYGRRTLT